MKKFTKLFLLCASTAAVTAAVATSAMAAESTLTATYATDESGSTGTVTITCASEDEVQTLLILKPDSDRTSIATTDILQIDQQDGSITTATVPALSEDNEDEKGTYTVLVGGTSGDLYIGTFSIGGEEVLMGDVVSPSGIYGNDATAVLKDVGDIEKLTGKAAFAADVISPSGIYGNDASAILRWVADYRDDSVGTTGTTATYSGE